MNKDKPNLALGAHQQPFSGIPTFMRLPATRDLKDVEVAIVGIPFDSGTSYRSGTRFGPRKIRESSLMLWGYNTVLEVNPTKTLNVIDYGDVDVVPVDIKATNKAITDEVGVVLNSNAKVISLGGDHSVSFPLLQAHKEKYGPVAVIHFDSHPDTWNEEYPDQPYSHGTPFIRSLENGLIDVEAYVQVGIRGSVESSKDYEDSRRLGARLITIQEAYNFGIPSLINEIRKIVGNRPVYLSFDIDSIDPAYAPGTGTPEVGGFTSYEMLQMIRGLHGLNFVGFDMVEVSPPYDNNDITSLLAANLVFEFLSLFALMKQE